MDWRTQHIGILRSIGSGEMDGYPSIADDISITDDIITETIYHDEYMHFFMESYSRCEIPINSTMIMLTDFEISYFCV